MWRWQMCCSLIHLVCLSCFTPHSVLAWMNEMVVAKNLFIYEYSTRVTQQGKPFLWAFVSTWTGSIWDKLIWFAQNFNHMMEGVNMTWVSISLASYEYSMLPHVQYHLSTKLTLSSFKIVSMLLTLDAGWACSILPTCIDSLQRMIS